ncbi:TonB-dependent siderophore receptor [Crenobacter luteus]|uniref:TonB-dependent receptor n=1 Tax=Crenobacter luteus TaxID=1452487 RepID=A0A165ELH6_9NEIS|nr:TonB-dependent siderophore receptor [Crenobacter luteus]KZE25392.1 hypothetical protein AVW16_03605 [Crenobacter luteus]
MSYPFHRRVVAVAVLAAFALPALAATGGEAELPTVSVTAQQGGNGMLSGYRAPVASTGALGTKTLLDTPFSISVATDDYIANQQASTLADAFKADAAVQAASNDIAGESSQLTIRGLQLDTLNGFKVDGLNTGLWMSNLPLEHFEQIELLKGLSGFMYGFSQPGGVVNYKLKRASREPVTTLTAGYGDESQYKLAADLGRRFGDDRFGLRLNLVHEGGDTYQDAPIERNSASLAFDARLTDSITLNLDTLYQKRKVNNAIFALALDGASTVPAPIPGDRKLAQDFSYYQTETSTHGASLRWDLNDSWNLRAAVRTALMKRTNYDSYLNVVDDAGHYDDFLYSWYSEHRSDSANLLLNGQFATGPIKHDLVVGADVQKVRRSAAESDGASLPGGNLYSGRAGGVSAPHLPIVTGPLSTIWQTRNIGVFVSDTIEWTPQWRTVLGLRHQNFRDRNDRWNELFEKKGALTPTVAAIWKPVDSTSLYASYVESLEKGNIAPTGTANEDQAFGPLESKQYEVGVKTEGAGWSAEAALFRVERGLAYTNSANRFVQEGGLIFNGLDLAGRVELGRDWALTASALVIDSENESDDATVNGKNAANTPKFSASLQAEYRLPALPGLTLTGGTRYVGKRYLESSNANQLGSYQLFDLGARYRTRFDGKELTLRAGVDNVANEKYWQANEWSWLTQGAPRTARVSAELKF